MWLLKIQNKHMTFHYETEDLTYNLPTKNFTYTLSTENFPYTLPTENMFMNLCTIVWGGALPFRISVQLTIIKILKTWRGVGPGLSRRAQGRDKLHGSRVYKNQFNVH